MAPRKTKRASKRSAPKIKIPNLRKRKAFIKEDLSRLLRWDETRINTYINNGQIRRAFDTINADRHLRDLKYYQCYASNEQLSALKHDEPLSAFFDTIIEENFISCPRYLYLPVPHPIVIPDPQILRGTIDFMTVFKNMPPELFSGTWVMLSYFYHLDGCALIPVEEDYTNFPLVKLQFELLEFPREEIERLKNPKKREGPYDKRWRESRIKAIQKKYNFDPREYREMSNAKQRIEKRKMRKRYFECFAKEVRAYEEKKLPKRTHAEIRKELESDQEEKNGFNNTWQDMYGSLGSAFMD